MGTEPRVLDAGCFPVQKEILGIDAIDLETTRCNDPLDLHVIGLDRHFHHLPGRRRNHDDLRLALLLGYDLDALIHLEDGDLLFRQAGMLGVFALLLVVPPVLDDAVTKQQRVVGAVPENPVARIVLHEDVIGVVRSLLGKLLIARLGGLVNAI
jgi:hypothetical protein